MGERNSEKSLSNNGEDSEGGAKKKTPSVRMVERNAAHWSHQRNGGDLSFFAG